MKVNFLYKMLISAYTFSMFSEGVILPIYAVFVQGIGGDILDASWAMATFLITQGVFTIIVHRFKWISEKRIPVMIFGWLLWVLGIGMYLFISNMATLLLAQILTAIGNAIADPIFDQELASHTDKKNESFEWGFFEGAQSLVQGLAAITGGLLATYFGFHVLIYAMVIAATTSFLLILFYTFKIRKSI